MDTVEEIQRTIRGEPILVPDAQLYIIVNSSKKTIWQSLVNVYELKAAVKQLKASNWFYANEDENSLDVKSRLMNKDGRFLKEDQYVSTSFGKRRCGSLQVACTTCSRAHVSMRFPWGSSLTVWGEHVWLLPVLVLTS